nr:hypothetical protein [Tanacetum cinerariifolium]GFC26381.1 hypothetical protein [Tanacetum cinerariifolium]
MAEDLRQTPFGVLLSNTVTDPLAELTVVTSMDGLTMDGSFIPHSNFLIYQDKEQDLETITEEDLEPNPHHSLIPYPSRLQEEKILALENPTRRANHFVYRIDIVDKFPIENNSKSGNPTPSFDFVVESLSPLPTPFRDSDSLVEETDALLSHFDIFSPEYETFNFDMEEKSSSSTTTHSDYSLPDYD